MVEQVNSTEVHVLSQVQEVIQVEEHVDSYILLLLLRNTLDGGTDQFWKLKASLT